MNGLRALPVILSFLLLGAHFLRSGHTVIAAACAALPLTVSRMNSLPSGKATSAVTSSLSSLTTAWVATGDWQLACSLRAIARSASVVCTVVA